jgi:hypothetical protein
MKCSVTNTDDPLLTPAAEEGRILFYQRMASYTHRNNIKPMLHVVSFMMMVLPCLFIAIYTLKCGRFGNFVFSYCVIHFISCLVFIREFLSLLYCGFSPLFSEHFNLIAGHIVQILQFNLLNFFWVSFSPRNTSLYVILLMCFVILLITSFSCIWIVSTRLNACNSMTMLTPIRESIFRSGGFDKFVQFFFGFASATSFHK